MNQRVMIAMAIACNPRLLIADEPTTALDVTIQAQILDLLRDLQRERGMALVLVTHNMGVVAEMARRVAVMYAGQVMEERGADALFAAPQHPYTAALLAAMPERSAGETRLATIPGVVPGLYDRPPGCLFAPRCAYADRRAATQRPRAAAVGRRRWSAATFRSAIRSAKRRSRATAGAWRRRERMSAAGRSARRRSAGAAAMRDAGRRRARPARASTRSAAACCASRRALQAVGGVSFAIDAGRTLAVVGESGCGKSTLARVVALIEPPSAGALDARRRRCGRRRRRRERRELRKTVQMVFQNPYGSLNPRKKIGAILEAPLEINTDARPRRARASARARCWPRSACGPSTTSAIRTCSRAASGSASRSRAR